MPKIDPFAWDDEEPDFEPIRHRPKEEKEVKKGNKKKGKHHDDAARQRKEYREGENREQD